MTDESQKALAGSLVLMAGFIAAFDQQQQPEIERIFAKYGVEPEGESRWIPATSTPIRDFWA